jgi:hypothetical protein
LAAHLHCAAAVTYNADLPTSARTALLHDHLDTTVTVRRRLRRVCAWCKRISPNGIEWCDDLPAGLGKTEISHGICPRCAAELT